MKRMRPWKRLLTLALGAFLAGAMAPAQAERADPEAFYNVPAFGDFQHNLQTALANGKKGLTAVDLQAIG